MLARLPGPNYSAPALGGGDLKGGRRRQVLLCHVDQEDRREQRNPAEHCAGEESLPGRVRQQIMAEASVRPAEELCRCRLLIGRQPVDEFLDVRPLQPALPATLRRMAVVVGERLQRRTSSAPDPVH